MVTASGASMANVAGSEKEWLPLESDPQVFSNYQLALGFPSALFKWHDIYGLDPEMWTQFIPQPVIGAIFCYEIKPQHRDMLEQEEAAQSTEEEQARLAAMAKPLFIKQIVRNACGTMALLHATVNVAD